jgi:hypothetical protein
MRSLRRQHSDRAARRLAASIIGVAGLVLTACGGGGAVAPSTTSTAPTPSPSLAPSPTPLPPAGGQVTSAGTVQLVSAVPAADVACSFPSLQGPEITLRTSATNGSVGGFITLTSRELFLRLGAGSGSSYTQRNFSGPGVTDFDAATGAQFNAQLTDVSPAGQKKGTIGSVTSLSGSVSCGDKTPGSGTITITGTSIGGAITDAITSMLVNCQGGASFAIVNGLAMIGGAPATVEIGGTPGAYFATFQTASASYLYSSAAQGLYTPGNGHVQWHNAVMTQTGAGGAGHTITVSGDAGCGT